MKMIDDKWNCAWLSCHKNIYYVIPFFSNISIQEIKVARILKYFFLFIDTNVAYI